MRLLLPLLDQISAFWPGAPAAIPTGRGLRLYFVEPAFRNSAEVEQGNGENERFFNVRALRDVRPGPDGLIRLRFDPAHGAPVINAIELLRCPDGQIPPIRLRSAELSFTDRTGRTWSPDDFFIGGKLATHKQDVTGTDIPDVYASERFGNFEYALPVPPRTVRHHPALRRNMVAV